jgi:nucleoside-diphosphate kinase
MFAKEQTLALIKPDGVSSSRIGEILSFYENKGLKIVGLKMVRPSREKIQEFYKEHQNRPFYEALTNYMTSGPIVAVVLEGDGAVLKLREVMGATDPKKALQGTIRQKFGTSVEKNAVHGSDSPSSAQREIEFFFKGEPLFTN